MTTGRRPTIPLDELAETIDEIEPVRAVESEAADVVTDADYYDRPPGDEREPQTRDLADRVTALEQARDRKSRRRTWGERIASFLAGAGLAIGAWALKQAEDRGDAKRAAAQHQAEHLWLLETVRQWQLRDAERKGQLDSIIDRLRYPVAGPPTAPREP